MTAKQIAFIMKQMSCKEISALVEDFLNEILESKYEEARKGFCSILYNVVEQAALDLLCWEMTDNILDKHTAVYFDNAMPLTRSAESYYPNMPLWKKELLHTM